MTSGQTPRGAWKIAALLFVFMLINFADKIVVGLAGVPIMSELELTPKQFGFLGSAFFFLFSTVHHQSRRNALGAARACPGVGAGAVSHARQRRFPHPRHLPFSVRVRAQHSWSPCTRYLSGFPTAA